MIKIVQEGPSMWNNQHQTYKQQITNLYNLNNDTNNPDFGQDPVLIYNDTTQGIQGIIQEAINSNTPLRALGGNWSLSTITATNGIILNTQLLNIIIGIGTDNISPDFKGDNNCLFLAQCGNSVQELSTRLFPLGCSLPASGASNGQTIAGAIATGTHGGGINFGAHQEAIVGLHIITSPTTSIWLERASAPVMADSFAAMINATPVRDDDAFNAAVVSFGAFGFIHGVMIQTEPLYLLEAYLKRVPFDDAFRHQVTALDFKYSLLPYPKDGDNPPVFHFQSLINPYDMKGGAYMTVMYKRPYRKNYTPPAVTDGGIGPGDDAASVIGKLTEAFPFTIKFLEDNILASKLKPYNAQFGTLAEIFSNTALRGKIASTAIGFSPAHTADVMDTLLQLNKSTPFVGVFAFRFVKSSKATMAFTRFAPVTCVLELDGVQSGGTMDFYNAVWDTLVQKGIPYTFHWGKMNNLTADKIKNMYGDALTSFQQQRTKYVDAATLNIFSNATLRSWGIDAAVPNIPSVPPASMIV